MVKLRERAREHSKKGELRVSYGLCKVCHVPIYKSKETVNVMKYNSQLISVEHRRIPHQKRLWKYSQLLAAQKPFHMDEKHVTFNLSGASYCHTPLSF